MPKSLGVGVVSEVFRTAYMPEDTGMFKSASSMVDKSISQTTVGIIAASLFR